MAARPSTWVICYINSAKLKFLDEELSQFPKYKQITAYIPMVKVLKKQFKNQKHYDEVPLLFNYGFFEVPSYFIYNPHFLDMMKKDISAIYAWVRNPGLTIEINPNWIATASSKEIMNLVLQQEDNSIRSGKDVEDLGVGSTVTLSGYPFDGLQAEIVEIDKKKKEVWVKLDLESSMTNRVKVDFDNIFFTVYKSDYMNTAMKEKSTDAFEAQSHSVDNLYTNVKL